MIRPRALSVAVVALCSLGLVACGGSTTASTASGGGTSGGTATAAPSTTAPVSPPTSVPIGTIADPSPAGTFGVKPTVTVPPGPPPSGLESADLIVGTGPAVTSADTVTVQYVGVAWSTKQQFDASWNDGTGQPVSFALDGVIPGWTLGMVGMKVGGRRELIIPPDLAYGAQGKGPIGPNETLIFIIDLVGIG